MIITCAKCGVQIKSLVIPDTEAMKEVMGRSFKHIQMRHPDMMKAMQEAVMPTVAALTNFMHMSEFYIVAENEKLILNSLEHWQEIVMTAIGFDVEDEEGEDLEGEDDELGLDPTDPANEVPLEEIAEPCDTARPVLIKP